jgi:hypothetical protein
MSLSPVEIRIYTDREQENIAVCINIACSKRWKVFHGCMFHKGQYITFIKKRTNTVRDSHCIRARHKEIKDTKCLKFFLIPKWKHYNHITWHIVIQTTELKEYESNRWLKRSCFLITFPIPQKDWAVNDNFIKFQVTEII